jgi:hypothetical protein
MSPDIKAIAYNFIREARTLEKINPSIGHKDFISRIRNMRKQTT